MRYTLLLALFPAFLIATLSIDDCVELAKKNNAAIEIAGYKTDRAIALKNEMRSGFLPTVELEGVIDNSNRSLSGDLTQFQDFHSNRAVGISINMGLWDFGVTWRRFRASKYRIDASQYQEAQILLDVEEKVRVAYLKVLEKEKLVQVMHTSYETLSLQLDKSKKFFEEGLVKRTDVLSLQVQLTDKEKRVLQAQNEALVERMRLNQLIGLSASDLSPLQDLEEISKSYSYDDALRFAYENRPDLYAYDKLLKALQLDRQATRWNFTPQIYAFGNGNYGSNTSTISAGLGMKMDLYSGGRSLATVQKLDAEIHELQAIVEDLHSLIAVELKNTCLQFEEIDKARLLDKQALELAEENLKNSQDLYNQGLLSINDVLIALEQLSLVKMHYFSSLYRYYMNHAHLVALTAGFGI